MNSGGDAERGRGWWAYRPACSAGWRSTWTGGGSAAAASGAAFTAAAATTGAQQVNAGDVSPW